MGIKSYGRALALGAGLFSLCVAGKSFFSSWQNKEYRDVLLETKPKVERVYEIEGELSSLMPSDGFRGVLRKYYEDKSYANRYDLLLSEYRELMQQTDVREGRNELESYIKNGQWNLGMGMIGGGVAGAAFVLFLVFGPYSSENERRMGEGRIKDITLRT